jgi:hypothetical protein
VACKEVKLTAGTGAAAGAALRWERRPDAFAAWDCYEQETLKNMLERDDLPPETKDEEGGETPAPQAAAPPPEAGGVHLEVLAQLRALQEWAYQAKANEARASVPEIRKPAGTPAERAGEPPETHREGPEPAHEQRQSPDHAEVAAAPELAAEVPTVAAAQEPDDAPGISAPAPAGNVAAESPVESTEQAAAAATTAPPAAADNATAAAAAPTDTQAVAADAAAGVAFAALAAAAAAPRQPAPGSSPTARPQAASARAAEAVPPPIRSLPGDQPSPPAAGDPRGRPPIQRRQGRPPVRPAATVAPPPKPAVSLPRSGRSAQPAPASEPSSARPSPARPASPRSAPPTWSAPPAQPVFPARRVSGARPVWQRLDRRKAAAWGVSIALVLLAVLLLRAPSHGPQGSASAPAPAVQAPAERLASTSTGEKSGERPRQGQPTRGEPAAAGPSRGTSPGLETPAPVDAQPVPRAPEPPSDPDALPPPPAPSTAPAGEPEHRLEPARPSAPPATIQWSPGSSRSTGSSGPRATAPRPPAPSPAPAAEAAAPDAGPKATPEPAPEIGNPGIPDTPDLNTPNPPGAPNLPGAPAAGGDTDTDTGAGDTPIPPPDETGAFRKPENPAAVSAPRARPAEDLNGSWEIRNVVNSTSYPGYRGLRLTYRIVLRQDGERIFGDGEKWAENDRRIPAAERTPIHVSGEVVGREVRVQFTERSSRRVSAGSFRWRLSPDGGSFSGTFASSAADSRGSSAAVRLP